MSDQHPYDPAGEPPTGAFPTPTQHDGRQGGRHPVDVGHLVMGVAFLGLVVVWALIHFGGLGVDDFRYLLPLPWVVGGGIGLVALAARSRTRTQQEN